MIVYSDRTREVTAAAALDDALASRDPLVHFGEVEAGVADALCPEEDSPSAVLERWRRAAIELARGGRVVTEALLDGAPRRVRVSPAEGYAYYALDWRAYRDAARQFRRDHPGAPVTVIGIRGIGTSLSAVVAAELDAESFTVRPRGHPFDREVRARYPIDPARVYAVVDEGPGLSGSSFASVARWLGEHAVPDSRIALFPSWLPDGEGFRSAAARDQWRRHPKYWMAAEDPPHDRDLSGGAWRDCVGAPEVAVQPQHERRKFLRSGVILRFAGYGRYGDRKLERARLLAESGLCPSPCGLENGYLRMPFLPGRPGPPMSGELLGVMAAYLAFLRAECSTGEAAPYARNRPMIEHNLAGLRIPPDPEEGEAVALDGRMLPHEWIETAEGFRKVDALDHHDDHFFPGCQDIAWDAAGAAVEFGVDPSGVAEAYRRASGERLSPARLHYHEAAYLAWRTGYATLASETLGESADGRAFAALAARYRERARRLLA